MMPKRPKYVGGLLLVLLLAVRLTGPQLFARYSSAFVPSDERDGSSQSRIDLWRDCLKVIAQYPVFGVGPANWRTIASSYGWTQGKSAHSVWMETAAEVGLPGALFLLLFFVTTAWKMWPLARASLTDENRYEVAVASGTVLSIVGFVISGQFVSAPALEVPYYVIMLGLGVLKSKSIREAAGATNDVLDPDAPAYQESPYGVRLPPTAVANSTAQLSGARWIPQRRF